jgi:nucleoside-diphosphate-sugar epimerase
VKVLVTGASGFVGAHTSLALERAGHDVRLLVRDPAKGGRVAAAVGLRGDDLAVADVTDRAAVEKALGGCDAVVHAAAAVALSRRRAAEIMAVNEAGARIVLETAADRGVTRIVHVSSTSALAVTPGRPLGADAPVAAGTGYAASKAAAERVARDLQAGGAPVRITYPAGVIGPAAGESLGETSQAMARFAAAGVLPTRRASLSLIDVRDLAAIHRHVVEADPAPPRVMCGGTHLTLPELGVQWSALTGRPFRTLPIPAAALPIVGRAVDRLASVLGRELPVTEESMALITGWPGTDDNVESELGLHYRPVAETLAAALEAWLGAGFLRPKQAGVVAPAVVPTRGTP